MIQNLNILLKKPLLRFGFFTLLNFVLNFLLYFAFAHVFHRDKLLADLLPGIIGIALTVSLFFVVQVILFVKYGDFKNIWRIVALNSLVIVAALIGLNLVTVNSNNSYIKFFQSRITTLTLGAIIVAGFYVLALGISQRFSKRNLVGFFVTVLSLVVLLTGLKSGVYAITKDGKIRHQQQSLRSKSRVDAELEGIGLYGPVNAAVKFKYWGVDFSTKEEGFRLAYVTLIFENGMSVYEYTTPSYFNPPTTCGMSHPEEKLDTDTSCMQIGTSQNGSSIYGRTVYYRYGVSYKDKQLGDTPSQSYFMKTGNTLITLKSENAEITPNDVTGIFSRLKPVTLQQLKKIPKNY